MRHTRPASRALVLCCLVTSLALLPAAARAGGCSPQTIPLGSYIGSGDGNDGTGTDAGMVCCDFLLFPTVPGEVSDVDVSLTLTHTFVGDLTVKLQSPQGTVSTILSRPGFAEPADDGTGLDGYSSNWSGSAILFDAQSSGPSAEDLGAFLADGQSVCLDDGICSYKPAPGSGPGLGLDVDFDGESYLGGPWHLCVGDSYIQDSGSFEDANLSLTLDRSIPCACNGKFRGGDHVIYAPSNVVGAGAGRDAGGEDPARGNQGPPPAGYIGEVMCGGFPPELPGYGILVRWGYGYGTGHNGNGYCECPIGTAIGNASWWVSCGDVLFDLPWSDDFETGNTDHWTVAVSPGA